MHLTPSAFKLKWNDRFANNDDFLVSEADMREYAVDIADSFGATVANVPYYVAGVPYAAGYLVRFVVAGSDESFYYALQAGQLPAPTGATDANWQVVPGPVASGALSQLLTLAQAQGLLATTAPVAGRLYVIDFGPTAQQQAQQVLVTGLGAAGFDVEGTLVVGGQASKVTVDVAAGTLTARATGGGSPLAFILTRTSSYAYSDMLLDVAAARLVSIDNFLNVVGLQLQVLELAGTAAGVAYRPYRDTMAAFNSDLDDFWTQFGSGARALARFRLLPATPALASHTALTFTVPPATALQLLQNHDTGFRLFGNQFAMATYEWNYAPNYQIVGGTITVPTGASNLPLTATGSPRFENAGSGLRMMLTARHNQAFSYDNLGFTDSTVPNSPGTNMAANFLLTQGSTVYAQRGGVQLASQAYTGQLLAIEVHDDGVRWYVGSTLLYYDPTPLTTQHLWIGAINYYAGCAWLDVQAGGQTSSPR